MLVTNYYLRAALNLILSAQRVSLHTRGWYLQLADRSSRRAIYLNREIAPIMRVLLREYINRRRAEK